MNIIVEYIALHITNINERVSWLQIMREWFMGFFV